MINKNFRRERDEIIKKKLDLLSRRLYEAKRKAKRYYDALVEEANEKYCRGI